jgi:hypothetical protein
MSRMDENGCKVPHSYEEELDVVFSRGRRHALEFSRDIRLLPRIQLGMKSLGLDCKVIMRFT